MEVLLQNNHAPKEIQNQIASHGTLVSAEHGPYNETVWNSLKHVMLDPYFAPLMAKDLSGLPKTLVYTVAQDILKDESTLYAKRLKAAGNDVEHYHNRGGFTPSIRGACRFIAGLERMPNFQIQKLELSLSITCKLLV